MSVADALDSTNLPRGLLSSASNLIPEPTTRNLWQSRPAAVEEYDFAGLSAPGVISVYKVIGTRVYGMIASALNVGQDEPFGYDLFTGMAVPISGITPVNTPITQPASGAWTPPTMSLCGTRLIVTHPGYTGGGGVKFGWFDISDPGAVTWAGGDTTPTNLAAVPTAVATFNDRAWYLVNPPTGQPAAYYSDVLAGTTITAGTQILTFDDNIPLTAAAGLGLKNQFGGIIQSLMIFKGATNIYQVTGDAALSTNPLSKNALNIATGTFSPRSIATTPKGLMFVSPEGVRLIDFSGMVSDPIGEAGQGITLPFIYSNVPSRVSASCNSRIYRVSVQNASVPGTPWQEWWYDIPRAMWSGPHTSHSRESDVYQATFVIAPTDHDAGLYISDTVQSTTSTFVEYGAQLTFTFQTTMMPDTLRMAQYNILEAWVKLAYSSGAGVINAYAIDENAAVLSSCQLQASGSATIWGSFIWGSAVWGGAPNALSPRQLNWPIPVVFQRVSFKLTGNSGNGLKIGDMMLRYEELGYMLPVGVAS